MPAMAEALIAEQRDRAEAIGWRIGMLLTGCVLLGVIEAFLWSGLAVRPGYLVAEDLTASMTERGLTQVISADVLFVGMSVITGLVTGIVCWRWFQHRGVLVCLLPVIGALATALIAWQLGLLIGERGFDQRLATAVAGETVRIDLSLRAGTALLVGPLMAITPVMLMAAFRPEYVSSQPEPTRAETSTTVE